MKHTTTVKKNVLFDLLMIAGLFLISFTLLSIFNSRTASAQTPTFSCDNEVYLSQFDTGETQLNTLDIDSDPITLTPIGSTFTGDYNAHGFRFQDGYVYAWNGTDFLQVDASGGVTNIGDDATPAPVSGIGYASGDIDSDGEHHMLEWDNATGLGNGNQWVVTDVTGPTSLNDFVITNDIVDADQGLAVGDFAYNPADGKFYGIDTRFNQAVMFDIDKVGGSGTATHFGATHDDIFDGPHGGAFINSKGQLVTIQNDPGMVWTIDIGINGNGTGEATLIGATPDTFTNDASACPYVPLIEKTGSPSEVEQGGEITYTYTIYNPAGEDLTFDFIDQLEEGFTYVADSLTNDLGGTPNSYGGTDTLSVADMTIASSTTVTFSVDVTVASDAPVGEMLNQACINDFSITSLETEVCSDYPVTPIFGDETPVNVLPPAAPDTGFASIDKNPWLILATTTVFSIAILFIANRLGYAKL